MSEKWVAKTWEEWAEHFNLEPESDLYAMCIAAWLNGKAVGMQEMSDLWHGRMKKEEAVK